MSICTSGSDVKGSHTHSLQHRQSQSPTNGQHRPVERVSCRNQWARSWEPDRKSPAVSQFRSASCRGAFEGHLRHNVTLSLSQSEAPPDAPSSPCFWRMHRYDPSWPHRSRDCLHTGKIRKTERKWRHHVKRLTSLTRSLWRTRLRRPQRPSPAEDADPELRRSHRSLSLAVVRWPTCSGEFCSWVWLDSMKNPDDAIAYKLSEHRACEGKILPAVSHQRCCALFYLLIMKWPREEAEPPLCWRWAARHWSLF